MFELPPSGTRQSGFSLTELVVAIAVAMILMAIGLPSFMRAYRAYQLNNAAREVADILRLARYEAIRLNHPVRCAIQASGANPGFTNVWVDSNNNNLLDPTEKMFLLGPSGNLVDGGSVPGTSALITAAVGSIVPNAPSPVSSAVRFDARGAVTQPPLIVNVFYLSSAVAPDAGYRAVFLMPAGSIEIWTADTAGNWQQQR
jgi:prepilin-type N-terminal cleavage/methylation domain-containing protein